MPQRAREKKCSLEVAILTGRRVVFLKIVVWVDHELLLVLALLRVFLLVLQFFAPPKTNISKFHYDHDHNGPT